MSRAYAMSVRVNNPDPNRVRAIEDAAEEEWDFDDWHVHEMHDGEGLRLTASGESRLYRGESEEEFADRLAKAIWIANGAYCEIEVAATCLEYLPFETHHRRLDDYEKCDFVIRKPPDVDDNDDD